MTVSVVVPTIGRPELTRALRSVRQQDTDCLIELIVVVDRSENDEWHHQPLVEADIVTFTGGNRGGGHARNAGVQLAQGQYIAFLDDDDEWLPSKIRRQLELVALSDRPDQTVVSSRHIHVDPEGRRASRPVPGRLKRPGERVDDYLFRRRRPTAGRASIYTSTLLCARTLALEVPWSSELRRHQDWDWLLRVSQSSIVEVIQAPEPLVRIQTGSRQSISAQSDWRSSLDWANAAFPENRAAYADFVTAQSLRYALAGRSWSGAAEIVGRLWSNRRVPATGPVVIGLGGLLPRHTIERVLTMRKGFRK